MYVLTRVLGACVVGQAAAVEVELLRVKLVCFESRSASAARTFWFYFVVFAEQIPRHHKKKERNQRENRGENAFNLLGGTRGFQFCTQRGVLSLGRLPLHSSGARGVYVA